METIFHNEPQIEEWVNQITEKIFTVCLLNGVDSDVEFQKGCLIVTKIASLLLGFSSFPSQYLEDGVRQLLEQQLPDQRVINNFPTFYNTMNRMLHEGISKVLESQKIEVEKSKVEVIEEDTQEVIEGEREEVKIIDEKLIEAPLVETLIEDVGIKGALLEKCDQGREEQILTQSESESNGFKNNQQVSEQAERLRHALSFMFPNKNVTWNFDLLGQTFLAQVEDTLIYLQDQHDPLDLRVYNKEGWKVVICNTEDIRFPRRLERRIRQFQRIGKKS